MKGDTKLNKKILLGVLFGVICLILTLAIIVQVKTVENYGIQTNPNFAEGDLRDQVLRWKEKYDNAAKELSKAEKELEKQRKKATEKDESSKDKEEQIKVGNAVIGISDVSGEGVEITLKDNQNITLETATLDMSYYVVHDIDILSIVNELKNAGAEAISINEQRIINTTSITCAGNVAQINGEKIGAPFVIKAIGSSSTLYEALKRPGGYVELLNSSGIITDIKKSNNIIIGKYNGTMNFKYAKDI